MKVQRANKWRPQLVITLIAIFLLAPIVATFFYSISTVWVKTILPNGLTFKWYGVLTADPNFIPSVIRSLLLAIAVVIVTMVAFLPVIFYANVYNPKLKEKLRYLSILPYSIPGIVLVTGLVQLYGNVAVPKIIILILTISAICLPAFYQSLNNAFMGDDFRGMFEQAQLLGDSKVGAFIRVVLPNIRAGLIVGLLLTFAAAFTEYVITNIFLTGQYQTLKIYMYRLMNTNGNAASVLTIIFFLFLGVIALILIKLVSNQKRAKKE